MASFMAPKSASPTRWCEFLSLMVCAMSETLRLGMIYCDWFVDANSCLSCRMVFLFRSGSYVTNPPSHIRQPLNDVFLTHHDRFRTKVISILKATRQHARNLGLFALIYKGTMLLLRRMSLKEHRYDSFLAGLLGGYYVFGRSRSSVNQQIVMYVFARVVLAFAKLAMSTRGDGPVAVAGDVYGRGAATGKNGGWGLIADDRFAKMVRRNSWPVFASLSWALVMWVFRWHPESVQPSLRSSMHYMYVFSTWSSCALIWFSVSRAVIGFEKFLLFPLGSSKQSQANPFEFSRYETADEWDSLRTLLWHNK